MSALCSQQRTSAVEPFHPLRYPDEGPLITFGLPDVSISFPNNPPAELVEHIRSEGGKDLTVKGKKIFLLHSPTPDLVRRVAEAGANRTTPAASESVNIAALGSLKLIRKIFSCFLFTHQYPAFADVDHIETSESAWKTERVTMKRSATSPRAGPSKKRAQASGSSVVGMDIYENEEGEEGEIQVVPPGEKILFALPPPKGSTGWGDGSDLGGGDGLFIRFVDETQNSTGEKIIQEVLGRYFIGCLGNNADACKAAMEKLRGDLGVIVTTLIGRELAHLAKCIDIGLQAQARIFPIVSDGQYLGSVLLGAGFQIHAYGNTYSPVSATALSKQIDQAGSHKSSLTAIANEINEDVTTAANKRVMAATSGLDLRAALNDLYTSNEERDKIIQLARGLKFKPKSWNVSANNLVTALSLIQDPTLPLPATFPVHPTKYFENDRLGLVWGAFGDLAPTPNFPGGPINDLSSTRDRSKHIGIRLVPLKDALTDMQMILSTKKFSGTSLNKRSGPFKDRIYTGVDGGRVIASLSSAAGVVQGQGSSKGERSSNVVNTTLFDDGF